MLWMVSCVPGSDWCYTVFPCGCGVWEPTPPQWPCTTNDFTSGDKYTRVVEGIYINNWAKSSLLQTPDNWHLSQLLAFFGSAGVPNPTGPLPPCRKCWCDQDTCSGGWNSPIQQLHLEASPSHLHSGKLWFLSSVTIVTIVVRQCPLLHTNDYMGWGDLTLETKTGVSALSIAFEGCNLVVAPKVKPALVTTFSNSITEHATRSHLSVGLTV